MPMMMMMSREVRRVPLDYEAPKDERRGGLQPRFDKFYVPTVKQWLVDREAWEDGTHPDREGHDYSFEEWDGPGPDPDYYYPGEGWPEDAEMGIQMYETVTEGTPISTVYPDTPDGRRAMAEELTTVDSGISSGLTVYQWMQIIEGQTLTRNVHTGEVA